MLKFIRKIFQEDQKGQKESFSVSLQYLEEWVSEKSKPAFEELKQKTDEILMHVGEELERTRTDLERLENAKLQNPNIPFKAKQYMEGNRKSYSRSMNSFLGNLEINNRDFFYLTDYCDKFDQRLDELGKSTIRSYTILQEFFSNETDKVTKDIKRFDDLFRQLKSELKNEKIVSINLLKEKAQSLRLKSNARLNLQMDLKNAEASLAIAQKEKEDLMRSIESFEKSEEHNNFLKSIEDKKTRAKELRDFEDGLFQSFSVLEKALRKYSHIAFEHEEMILKYLHDPIGSISDDPELKIHNALTSLLSVLEENNLIIEEKKREKSIEEIKKLSRDFLSQFRENHFALKDGLKEVEDRLNRSGVQQKFRELNLRLQDTNLRTEKLSKECNQSKSDALKMDEAMLTLKTDIEKSVKSLFNEEINIAF